MFEVPLIGDTLSHEQIGEYKASRVLLKPAAPGTGVKAGGTLRGILMVLGVHNVLTKSLGRNNPINLAHAAMNALENMRRPQEVEELRGIKIVLKHPQWYDTESGKTLEEQPDVNANEPSADQPQVTEAGEDQGAEDNA